MYTCATMAYSIQLQTTLTDINFVVYKSKKKAYKQVGVYKQWTGMVDWNTGMEYWTHL